MQVEFHFQTVGDVEVFYRLGGPADAPVVLLLHGFPTASHMFRDLIPELAGRYRVIAPDLPGFGNTKAPPRGTFSYSFDGLATVMGDFVEALHLDRYALYIFDYGSPVGLRLAMAHPERVTAIVTQNGNAYIEGSATHGRPGVPAGPRPRPRTARPAGPRWTPKSSAPVNICTAPIPRSSRRTATHWTTPTWHGPEPRRSSST